MDYVDFLGLLSRSDLILSDSGGIQEETATLGIPLAILRTVTERPEILDTGIAVLTPDAPALERYLDAIGAHGRWPARGRPQSNPFGDGSSGPRIARAIDDFVR
jgi:UDP-N-acetylglucosamine 2-epimerase (non-hydrolysing)